MGYWLIAGALALGAVAIGFLRGVYRSFVAAKLFSWYHDSLLVLVYFGFGIMVGTFLYKDWHTAGENSANTSGAFIVSIVWVLGLVMVLGIPKVFEAKFGVK